VERGHAVEDIGAARGDEEDEGDAERDSLVGRLGQPHPVRVGDGTPTHGPEGAHDDGIAAADPPDLGRDGADDSLADGGRLLHAGHRDRM
jgi:hypothetical protein